MVISQENVNDEHPLASRDTITIPCKEYLQYPVNKTYNTLWILLTIAVLGLFFYMIWDQWNVCTTIGWF